MKKNIEEKTKSCLIFNKTKGKLPSLPFCQIKDAILPEDYVVNIIFIDTEFSKKLNNDYRKKNYATNILSFEIEDNFGEIYITPKVASTEYQKFSLTYDNFLIYLLIHGFLHLKGMKHSSMMETTEKLFLEKFKI